MPYPLIFGYIADSACLIWESKCGKTGNCWVYDHDKFRNYLHVAAIGFIAIGSCFDFATIFLAGRVKNFYEDDDEEEEDKGAVQKTHDQSSDSGDFNMVTLHSTNTTLQNTDSP